MLVPIELWREIASERETAYLLKSDAMKKRLLAAKDRQAGISLDDEPFIGMWRDREDLADSSQAVRELRKSQWGEKQSVRIDDV